MRSTVTLDSDVNDLVRERMRQRGVSFKRVINEGLRAGLAARGPRRRYRIQPMSLGEPLVPLKHALRIAADLKDAALADKRF